MELDSFITCSKCKEVKHSSLFFRDPRNKTGKRSECKACGCLNRKPPVDREKANDARRKKRAEEREARKSLSPEDRQALVVKRKGERQAALARKIQNGFDAASERARNCASATAYRIENWEQVKARKRQRNRNVSLATPPWVKRKDMERDFKTIALMFRIYTGQIYQVDHVVPLQGKIGTELIVCGLHCDANLMVIPEADNRRKSNQIWPDMP